MSGPAPRGVQQPLLPPHPTLAERWAESRAPLVERLRDAIHAGGPITFARFMEAALYDPRDGYYAARGDERDRGPRTTREGDFLTAPEMDPLFGAVLARQLEECWERLGRPDPFDALRRGAGTAPSASGLLQELRVARRRCSTRWLPAPGGRTRRARPPSSPRVAAEGLGPRLHPAGRARDPLRGRRRGQRVARRPARPPPDASRRRGPRAPHRPGGTAGSPTSSRPPSDPRLLERPRRVRASRLARGRSSRGLARGRRPGSRPCRGRPGARLAAADRLRRPAARRSGERRHPEGLLRTYRAHHAGADPYRAVGRQDLTAHVDTTALASAPPTPPA